MVPRVLQMAQYEAHRLRRVAAFGLLGVALAGLSGFAAPDAQAAPRLFEREESASTNLHPFPKWEKVLARQEDGLRQMRRDCDAASADAACGWTRWRELVRKAKTLKGRALYDYVNRTVNEIPYIEDRDNWGQGDFWASTDEFFSRNGDCEDFSITKYFALKEAGVSPERMRIVVLQDHNLGILHAVLAVYDASDILILDNQLEKTVSHRSIRHYQPIYSINERHWWRHGNASHQMASVR